MLYPVRECGRPVLRSLTKRVWWHRPIELPEYLGLPHHFVNEE